MKTLSIITHTASKSGNINTTIIVHIFAQPNNAKYANANQNAIVHTSLINQLGRNSIIVPTKVTTKKSIAYHDTSLSKSNLSRLMSGNAGITTRVNNANIVRNQIEETHVASQYIQSNQLIALINNRNHQTVKTKLLNHHSSITNPFIHVNSVIPTQLYIHAKLIAESCANSLTIG